MAKMESAVLFPFWEYVPEDEEHAMHRNNGQ